MIFEEISNILTYILHDFWQEGADPRSIKLPLLSSGPWFMTIILAIYLIVIKWLGPKFMSNRPPYNIKRIVVLYNVAMVVLNSIFFATTFWYTSFGTVTVNCSSVKNYQNFSEDASHLKVAWYYMVFKLVDLFTSILFVLRKKFSQLSFLHVYHHTITPICLWLGIKYSPYLSTGFFLVVNSFVHVIMYSYYALTSMSYPVPIRWKQMITYIQITQLIAVVINYIYLAITPECKLPSKAAYVLTIFPLTLVALFIQFSIESYMKPSKIPDSNKSIKNF